MLTEGRHIIAEISGADKALLNDGEFVENAIRKAIFRAGDRLVYLHRHQFPVEGVSVNATLAASHFCIHTWPSHRYASIDYYTCSDYSKPDLAVHLVSQELRYKHVDIMTLRRAVPYEVESSYPILGIVATRSPGPMPGYVLEPLATIQTGRKGATEPHKASKELASV